MKPTSTQRRFYVSYSWDGESLDDGRDHTWDVIDRYSGYSVYNADTRSTARREAAELNRQHERTFADRSVPA